MAPSQRPQRLTALLCFALVFGIASCSTDNLYCYYSSCTQYVNFYANSIDSKTININVPSLSQAYVYIYVSDNEQDIDLSFSSSPGPIDSTVDVNSRVLLQPGNAYSWSGYMKLPQMSITSSNNRHIGYTLENHSYISATVQINLDITRFETYSNSKTAIKLIVIIVPIVISLLSVTSLGACYIRRRRRTKTRQQQQAISVRTLDPIATSRQPMQDQQQMSYGFPQSPQEMAYMQNAQYYPNQYQYQYQYQYPQGQYMQGYPQGYDQGQGVYYAPQNQGPTYVMQA